MAFALHMARPARVHSTAPSNAAQSGVKRGVPRPEGRLAELVLSYTALVDLRPAARSRLIRMTLSVLALIRAGELCLTSSRDSEATTDLGLRGWARLSGQPER